MSQQQQERKKDDHSNKYSLDYSKWDKIGDDDDDDSDEGRRRLRPRVTRLDEPSSVTFGGQPQQQQQQPRTTAPARPAGDHSSSALISAELPAPSLLPPKIPAAPTADKSSVVVADDNTATATSTTTTEAPSSARCYTVPASWTDKGAAVPLPQIQEGDGSDAAAAAEGTIRKSPTNTTPHQYYWSQDRAAVHVRIPLVPVETTAAEACKISYHVSVSHILSYAERYHAVMSSSNEPQRLVITAQQQQQQQGSAATPTTPTETTILLQGNLMHPVHLAEEDEEDVNTVDWSIEHHPDEGRYILVSLSKATPVMGMTLWWKKLLQENSTEIELTWVERNTAFQQAWDQAHEQFRASGATNTTRPKYSV